MRRPHLVLSAALLAACGQPQQPTSVTLVLVPLATTAGERDAEQRGLLGLLATRLPAVRNPTLVIDAAGCDATGTQLVLRLQGRLTPSRDLSAFELQDCKTGCRPGGRSWARLIARIYEVDPLRCRRCGGNLQIIAFITERAVIVRILDHLGELERAPRMAPIRGPPHRAMQQQDDLGNRRSRHLDLPVDLMPDYENQNQGLVW